MKKIIFCALISVVSMLNIEALLIDQYKKHANLFDPSTDLVRGMVLLNNGSIEAQRVYGNIEYYRNDSFACSYMDKGLDAMSRLLVILFPSAGISLNADGAGSILKNFKDEKNGQLYVHVNIIAGMLRIANSVRAQISQNLIENKGERSGVTEFADIQQVIDLKNKKLSKDDLDRIATLENDLQQAEIEKRGILSNNSNDKKSQKTARREIEKKISSIKNKIANIKMKNVKACYGNFVRKYFGISGKYFGGKEEVLTNDDTLSESDSNNLETLFELGRNAAEAVLLERLDKDIYNGNSDEIDNKIDNESDDDEEELDSSLQERFDHPYWHGYTNDLICAYAWETLPEKKLKDLAYAIKFGPIMDRKTNELSGDYTSRLTEIIWEEMRPDLSVIPFYQGQKVISNGVTPWDGSTFADCCETTLRHLFSLIFCSASTKNGVTTLTVAEDRIPILSAEQLSAKGSGYENFGKQLKDFFCCKKNIRAIASDGSPETRGKWARICGKKAKEGIVYCNNDHNLESCWKNIIKLFCLLMRDYPEMIKLRKENVRRKSSKSHRSYK